MTTKTQCSNFHFYLPHSDPYFSSCTFSLFLTLFMFPLLFTYPPNVHSLCDYSPHLFFPFFLVEQFLFKNIVFFFFFQDLRVSFSRLFHCLFSSLSVSQPSVFLLLFVSSFVFLFCFFQSCSFEKMLHFSEQKISLRISQKLFL